PGHKARDDTSTVQLLDERRDLAVVSARAISQSPHYPGAVTRLAVLAHLHLALEARDGELQTDDAARHHRQIILGCVGCPPWRRIGRFLLLRELGDVSEQPSLVLHR